jgi:hypothetical protein
MYHRRARWQCCRPSASASWSLGDERRAVDTSLVADLQPGPGWSHPTGFTVLADRLYFIAWAPAASRSLWAIDR